MGLLDPANLNPPGRTRGRLHYLLPDSVCADRQSLRPCEGSLFGAFGLLVNYICFMLGNAFLRLGMAKAFFCVLPVWLLLHGSSYGSSDTSLQLALNSAAPPGGLSLLNGLAYSLGSVEKMVLPVASSSLYAFGVERQILWGNFLWAVLLGLLCIHSFVLVKYRRYLTAE